MTMTAELAAYLRTLPGRCVDCLWHEPTQGHRLGCPAGLRLADMGMDATTKANPDDAELVDSVIAAAIRKGSEWSLNDLRPYLSGVKNRAVIGARINAAIRGRQIKRVGDVQSTDPATHGHRIGLYWAA